MPLRHADPPGREEGLCHVQHTDFLVAGGERVDLPRATQSPDRRLVLLPRDRQRPIEWEGAIVLLQQAFDIAASHQFPHDVRCAFVFADIEDGDNVLVRSQPAHRLRLADHSLPARRVESFGLDQRKSDIAVEHGVVREEHPLLPALAEETANDVTIPDERLWNLGGR